MTAEELQDLYDDLVSTQGASVSRECAIELLEEIISLRQSVNELKIDLDVAESRLKHCVAFDYTDIIKPKPKATFSFPDFEWSKSEGE